MPHRLHVTQSKHHTGAHRPGLSIQPHLLEICQATKPPRNHQISRNGRLHGPLFLQRKHPHRHRKGQPLVPVKN